VQDIIQTAKQYVLGHWDTYWDVPCVCLFTV